MKKTVISVLIVLLLSFGFLGCGDQPCEVCGAATKAECICKAENASNLSDTAKGHLTTMGETVTTFPTPLGTTFHDCKYATATSAIVIIWKDANQAMFDHYKKAWESRARAAVQVEDSSSLISATIEFLPDGGSDTDWSLEFPAGSIVFRGRK